MFRFIQSFERLYKSVRITKGEAIKIASPLVILSLLSTGKCHVPDRTTLSTLTQQNLCSVAPEPHLAELDDTATVGVGGDVQAIELVGCAVVEVKAAAQVARSKALVAACVQSGEVGTVVAALQCPVLGVATRCIIAAGDDIARNHTTGTASKAILQP